MSLTSRLISRLMKLPPAETHDFVLTRDLRVPMPDGVILLGDHYAPRNGPTRPTILVRSPYGRSGFFSSVFALPYVTHGYQVFIQSCRGTAGSGGDFVYVRNERSDGLATIEWIKQQAWFSGELAMVGASYLGFVQWAVAAEASAELKALVPSVTTSDANRFRYQGGSLTLESMFGWSTMMTRTAATGPTLGALFTQRRQERQLEKGYAHLPLGEADRVAIGQPSSHFQDVITHSADDDYWKAIDFSASVGEVTAPIALQAGWYDLFLDWQLQDYQHLRAAGRQPYLLIGPWFHGEFASLGATTRDSLAWLNAQVKGDQRGLREQPVRLFVMGANVWRDVADWPPPARSERWHLHPGGALAQAAPPASAPDRYRYDPADPTPTVGGNSLGARARMGVRENRKVEARQDVLVYTSAALEDDLEVIGRVRADLYVRSSLEHTDFFVRLCAVEASGKSLNLCDSIVRLEPGQSEPEADGIRHLQIDLWPTAYRFRRGQHLRVQVASGAHPRFARNTGSGEPSATATKLIAADQAIYHDPEHPSAILLPVFTG